MSALEQVLTELEWRFRPVEREQQILCPNPDHEETNPSCSLNLAKGLWVCYGCGKAGDVYTLLQLREGLTFIQAKAKVEAITGEKPSSSKSGNGGFYKQKYTVKRRTWS